MIYLRFVGLDFEFVNDENLNEEKEIKSWIRQCRYQDIKKPYLHMCEPLSELLKLLLVTLFIIFSLEVGNNNNAL